MDRKYKIHYNISMKRYIYKITNQSGLFYIGKANDFNVRMDRYKYTLAAGQPALNNSILKYGWKNHKKEILWQGECTEKQIYRLEKFFIKKLKPELNCNAGGLGGAQTGQGLKNLRATMATNEYKEKKRQNTIDCWNKKEYRDKMSAIQQSDEYKIKQSESFIRYHKENKEEFLNAVNKPETKKKQSDAAVNRWKRKDYRDKQLKTNNQLKKDGVFTSIWESNLKNINHNVRKMGCCGHNDGIHPHTKWKILKYLGLNHWDEYIRDCKLHTIQVGG